MTDLTNEVREALDNLLISAGVRPFTRMAAKQYGTNEVCALIAAIEAAQLQYLGNLSDAEIVEAAFPFNTEDDTPTWSAAYEPAKLVHKHFCERVCAALPILQAPLRAEIERLHINLNECEAQNHDYEEAVNDLAACLAAANFLGEGK